MSLDISEGLKWNIFAWTLNIDQIPANKDNRRKADGCDLRVENWNNPFLPKLPLVLVVIAALEGSLEPGGVGGF